MMIPYSTVQSYSALRSAITDAGLADLDLLLASIATEPPNVQREALKELLPELGAQYVGATSLTAAQFYEELVDMQGVKNPITPEIIPLADRARWHALVDWSADDYVFQHLGPNMVYSRIAGNFTRQLTEAAADTMIGNAQMQQGTRLSAQRVPKAGCCAFCAMLASRGAVYSPESASGVVGRGKPVGSHPLAKGIKPRGSRQLGEKYHDHCRCEVVVVTPENEVELMAIEEHYLDVYTDAAKKAEEGRSLHWTEVEAKDGSKKRQYRWEKDDKTHTHRDKTKDIVTFMRYELAIK